VQHDCLLGLLGFWGLGRIQRYGGFDQGFQRLLVDRIAFADIDGAARSAIEARIEKTGGILERGAAGECELDFVLLGFAGADDAVLRPSWHACRIRGLLPLGYFDRLGRSVFDHDANACEHLTAPIRRGFLRTGFLLR